MLDQHLFNFPWCDLVTLDFKHVVLSANKVHEAIIVKPADVARIKNALAWQRPRPQLLIRLRSIIPIASHNGTTANDQLSRCATVMACAFLVDHPKLSIWDRLSNTGL